jgi:hypothetical protein
MSELDRLQQLARETQLLAPTGDVANMRRTSYEFTRRAVSALRREGWRHVKAPDGGDAINGVRIDQIINRNTCEIVRIIANADDPAPDAPPRATTWQSEGFGIVTQIADTCTPTLDASTVPAASSPPVLELPAGADLQISLGLLRDAINANTQTLRVLIDQAAQIQAEGVRVRVK